MKTTYSEIFNIKRSFLILFALIFSTFFAFGQIEEPVKWSFETKNLGNNEAELIFKATIEKNWHLYSQDIPDGGPIKTSFFFNKIEGFEFIDKNIEIELVENWEEEGSFYPGLLLMNLPPS